MVSLIPDESMARIKVLLGTMLESFEPNEIQALVTADLEDQVNNRRLQQITEAHPTDFTRMLQSLVARGALVKQGDGRWSRYRLPRREQRMDSPGNVADSVHNDLDSAHNRVDSIHNAIHKDEISVEQWQALLVTAAPARQQDRLPPEQMEALVQGLCSSTWLTRSELGELLQRNSDGLRSRFLKPMVDAGRLVLRYPDRPNRPDQTYRSVADDDAETDQP